MEPESINPIWGVMMGAVHQICPLALFLMQHVRADGARAYQLMNYPAFGASKERLPLTSARDAENLKLLHRCVGELGLWTVASDDKHKNCVLTGFCGSHVLKTPDSSRRKGYHVERIQIDRFRLCLRHSPKNSATLQSLE